MSVAFASFSLSANSAMGGAAASFAVMDSVKVLKLNTSYLFGYGSDENVSALSLGYHQGLYGLFGFQYDINVGYSFENKQSYLEAHGGVGFLFLFFDIGFKKTFGVNPGTAIQYGLSTMFYSSYDHYFMQASFYSQNALASNALSDGFRVQLSYGYKFNNSRSGY